MDTSLVFSVLGTFASLAGFFIAALQTIRLRELRRRNNADVWQSIRMARSMMGRLEPCSVLKQGDANVREAYSKSAELFGHLIKLAILDERLFTNDTIRRWRSSGRLTSDWQEAQARLFLQTTRY
jgi:hypothetical protein